jgi:Carboxypeptidase regulatory-like domain
MTRRAAVFVVMALMLVSLPALAQNNQEMRSVSGKVVSAQDQPLTKAVVHLKNTKTLVIKTYITEPDGTYRFSALSPNVDYEIYAEREGQRSDTRTLSAFDNRKQLTVTLKIRSEK